MIRARDKVIEHARKFFLSAIILAATLNPFRAASEVNKESGPGTSTLDTSA